MSQTIFCCLQDIQYNELKMNMPVFCRRVRERFSSQLYCVKKKGPIHFLPDSFFIFADLFLCRLHHIQYMLTCQSPPLFIYHVGPFASSRKKKKNPTWLSLWCAACLWLQATNTGTVISLQHKDELEDNAHICRLFYPPVCPPTAHAAAYTSICLDRAGSSWETITV